MLDNFIIHKSKRTLRCLAALGRHVVLHFLPPYSLLSNVIERLWKQLHDHVTRNHRHRTIEPLMEAVDEFIEGPSPSQEPRCVDARPCSVKLSQKSAGYLERAWTSGTFPAARS